MQSCQYEAAQLQGCNVLGPYGDVQQELNVSRLQCYKD